MYANVDKIAIFTVITENYVVVGKSVWILIYSTKLFGKEKLHRMYGFYSKIHINSKRKEKLEAHMKQSIH